MDKAAERLKDDEKRSICAVVKPTPKKAAKSTPVKPTSWAQCVRGSYEELSEAEEEPMEEDGDAQSEAEPEDNISTSGDLISDAEYDKPADAPAKFLHREDKKAPAMLKPTRFTKYKLDKSDDDKQQSACPAAETDSPQMSAMQLKLAELENQRAQIAAKNESFKAENEARAKTQAEEMQGMMQGLEKLQQLVATNQQQANDMMQKANESFTAFQKDMTQAATQATLGRAADQKQSNEKFDLLS
jgi:hypothetical protein